MESRGVQKYKQTNRGSREIHKRKKKTTNNNEREEKLEKEINQVKGQLTEIQNALRAITDKQH